MKKTKLFRFVVVVVMLFVVIDNIYLIMQGEPFNTFYLASNFILGGIALIALKDKAPTTTEISN